MLRVLLGFLILALAACGDAGPEPDATRLGYVEVWVIQSGALDPERESLVVLSNGDAEIEILINDDTAFVNPLAGGGRFAWSFDDVYRVDGVLNWVPEAMREETRMGIAGVDDWLWATRIERLEPDEAEALIAAGEVARKN